MAGPLAGYRVLDLSRILAGPWLAQLLSDLGAEVWKIERPGTGDDTRQWGPPFLRKDGGIDTTESAYFLSANRGKHSICVDISTDEGSAIVRALAQQADLVIENYKVGDMARYGLDFATLSAENPRLIYCSVTGFGQEGPYSHRAGYDFMIQAMGGLMSITGERDDLPGGGPQKCGVPIADMMTGMYAAVAVLGALRERDSSGLGQHIDMALLDVSMAILANQAAGYLNTGKVPQRQGNSHPSLVPYQSLPTLDGAMLLAVGNDGQFARFCDAAGQPQWAHDPRYATNTLRVANRDSLSIWINGGAPTVSTFSSNGTPSPSVGAIHLGDNPLGVAAANGTVNSADGKIDEAVESGESSANDPGLAMYTSSRTFYVQFPRLSPGDVVTITGEYDEFFEESQITITSIDGLAVSGTGTIPAPIDVAPTDVVVGADMAEAYEGVLVQVEDVTVVANDLDFGELGRDVGGAAFHGRAGDDGGLAGHGLEIDDAKRLIDGRAAEHVRM